MLPAPGQLLQIHSSTITAKGQPLLLSSWFPLDMDSSSVQVHSLLLESDCRRDGGVAGTREELPLCSKASRVALVLGRRTAREHVGSDAVYELLLTFPRAEMALVVRL